MTSCWRGKRTARGGVANYIKGEMHGGQNFGGQTNILPFLWYARLPLGAGFIRLSMMRREKKAKILVYDPFSFNFSP